MDERESLLMKPGEIDWVDLGSLHPGIRPVRAGSSGAPSILRCRSPDTNSTLSLRRLAARDRRTASARSASRLPWPS